MKIARIGLSFLAVGALIFSSAGAAGAQNSLSKQDPVSQTSNIETLDRLEEEPRQLASPSDLSNKNIEILDALLFGRGELAKKLRIQEIPLDKEDPQYLTARHDFYERNHSRLEQAVENIDSEQVNEVESGVIELEEIVIDDLARQRGALENVDSSEVSPMVCTPWTGCALGWYLYAAAAVHNTIAITAGAWLVVGLVEHAAVGTASLESQPIAVQAQNEENSDINYATREELIASLTKMNL